MKFRCSLQQILFLLIFGGLSVFANAQKSGKIAYLEETKILKSIEGYESNISRIDSLKNSYVQEIQASLKNIQSKISELTSNYDIVKEDNLESLKEKLNETDKLKFDLYLKENELLTKKEKDYAAVLESDFKTTVQPILERINAFVEAYAKKNSISVILNVESANLAYIDTSLNITDAIIEGLKK